MFGSLFGEKEAEGTIVVAGKDLQSVVDELTSRIDSKAERTFQRSKAELMKSEQSLNLAIDERSEKTSALQRELDTHREELAQVPADVKANRAIADATSREHKEVLATLAAMHSDMEGLRDQIAKLKAALSQHANEAGTRVINLENKVQGQDSRLQVLEGNQDKQYSAIKNQLDGLSDYKASLDKSMQQSMSAQQRVKALEEDIQKFRKDVHANHSEYNVQVKSLRTHVDSYAGNVKSMSDTHTVHSRDLGDLKNDMKSHGEKLNKAIDGKSKLDELAKAIENALRKEITDTKDQCRSQISIETGSMKSEIEALKKGASESATGKQKKDADTKQAIDKILASMDQLKEQNRKLQEQIEKDKLGTLEQLSKNAENIEKLNESLMTEIRKAVGAERDSRAKQDAAEKASREKDAAALQASVKELAEKVSAAQNDAKKQSGAETLRKVIQPELQKLTSKHTELETNLNKLDKQLSSMKGAPGAVDDQHAKRLIALEQSHVQHREQTDKSLKGLKEGLDGAMKKKDEGKLPEVQSWLEETKTQVISLTSQCEEMVKMIDSNRKLCENNLKDLDKRLADQEVQLSAMGENIDSNRLLMVERFTSTSQRIDELKGSIDKEIADRCIRDAQLQAKIARDCADVRKLVEGAMATVQSKPVSRDINLDGSKQFQDSLEKEQSERMGLQTELRDLRDKVDQLHNVSIYQLGEHKDYTQKRLTDHQQTQTDLRRKVSEVAQRAENLWTELTQEINTRAEKDMHITKDLKQSIDEECAIRRRELLQTRAEVVGAVEREREERVKENTEQRTMMTKAMRELKVTVEDEPSSWFGWGNKANRTSAAYPPQETEGPKEAK